MKLDRLSASLWGAGPTVDPEPLTGPGGGVEGNARLTATTGVALFVITAVEGVTLLQIRQLVSVHVFVGLLLLPLVLLKTASTGYRFGRYYVGDSRYTRKGPPRLILRVTGPLVVVSTLLLFGTGIALLPLGRAGGDGLRGIHQKAFIVWIALMGIHVLGHLRDTITLATADWRSGPGEDRLQPSVAGARLRLGVLVAAIGVGVVLGVLSLGWVGDWAHRVGLDHGG